MDYKKEHATDNSLPDVLQLSYKDTLLTVDFQSGEYKLIHEGEEPILTSTTEIKDGKSILNIFVEQLRSRRKISITTFGDFEVYVDEKPISFRSSQTKELLAILVDARGGFLTNRRIISYLWEDENDIKKQMGRLRGLFFRLRKELAEYGIQDILETYPDQKRIRNERVSCDYFDYMNNPNAQVLFPESYMKDYSWAENTIPAILDR